MRSFLSALLTATAIILTLPTGLILASWNAIPGDSLYGVKRSFEGVALAVTVNTPLASAFSLKFTDRRFSEANRLLAKSGSTLGYSLLVEGARQSKEIIVEKNDTQSATQLIQNIETYQKTIGEKKFALASQPQAAIPFATPVVIPLPQPTQSIATPRPPVQTPVAISTPIPQPTPQPVTQVVSDLNQTNEELEKIKKELEEKVKKEHDTSRPEKSRENREENRGKNQ